MPRRPNSDHVIAVLLFLKAPRKGHVKTRLAHTTGSDRALKAYRALVERQWTQLPTNARIEVHYTPSDAGFEMQQWLGHEYDYFPQSEGELGLRLQHSVQDAFKRGANSVFCIGGDCPLLDEHHFKDAAAALAHDCDVVFGPTEDGGYYLIGLNSNQPELFQDIPWSTHNTLSSSLNQAKNLGLHVKLLEKLYDIDEITELERAIEDKRLPPEIMDHE